MIILDGKKLANEIKEELMCKVKHCKRPPSLCIIQVGNDPASEVYIRMKKKMCDNIGYTLYHEHLDYKTTEHMLIDFIHSLNKNRDIDAILVQLPLPDHINSTRILNHIDHNKDVDGLTSYNMGRLMCRLPNIEPCTPKGIITLLEHYNIDIIGKHAVIVGASNIVGRPMGMGLLLKKATVTICHRFTTHLKEHIKQADILIVAIGKPDIIQSDWIKRGCVVIDVGINRLDNNKIVGDIDFETAKERASYITPVPGGIGPMTVISLMENTLVCYEKNNKL